MEKTMGVLKLMIHVMVAFMGFISSCRSRSRSLISGVSPQFNDDVLGLIVFKSDLLDPSAYLETWNEDDESPCKWRFIACNPENGRVSEISLDGLGLSGRLGRGLEKLQYLKVLSLAHNNFHGDVSSETILPSSLQRVDLSFNSFSGPIASFLSMASIRFLDLSENSFSGSIEDVLFENCSSLHFLSLASNKLEGPLPSSLSDCILLNTLNLSNNHFSGQPDFSSGIRKLKRLRTLDFSNNAFYGFVHQGISSLHFLKVLFLHKNQFSGPLPSDIGLCPHLEKLDFSDNLLSGSLPNSMSLLNSLSFISLSNNSLTGDFPPWIGSMGRLEYIDFSSNNIEGGLPSSMGGLQLLSHLSLSKNKLSGGIPASLVDCKNLRVLRLEGNDFNGSVPDGLFELGLEEIDLSNNRLIGSVPEGSSQLHQSLQTLDLSKNSFTGNFPAAIGQFINLRHLNLSWNNLESKIQPDLGLLDRLSVLDLRGNGLYGSIPSDICDSESLQVLQLDENSLTGSIPDEIGNCSSLNLLSLSGNDLSGSIPKSISNLKKLKILQLEHNKLSGEIPKELGTLNNLIALNVSYNRLIGRLPVGGIFQSLDQSALMGNLGICSPLLKGPCKMNVSKPLFLDPDTYSDQMGGHKQRNRSSESENSNPHVLLSVSAIVAIAAAILIAVGVIVISFLNVSVRRKLEFLETAIERSSMTSKSGNEPTGKLILFDSDTSPVTNPESLLNKASEIGGGVFGTVYKVSLGTKGPVVAIKKLVSSNSPPNPEEFDREVRILAKAKHPNLISVKGYYLSPHTQLLLSDYASNGSLQALLHERISPSPPLSWPFRLKIIHSTAKGLAYLHHSFHPPIIHYSLRPNNILFDENYSLRISDFGHARLLNKLNKHVINSRFQSTWGYVAPELACQSLRVNEKCDVYCFGVIILELVTGKRPVEYGEDNVVILKDHVRVLLEHGNVLDCVDPSMREFSENEVLPVLKLALVCTSQLPSSRPSMAEVVQILEVIQSPDSQRMDFGNSMNQNSDST